MLQKIKHIKERWRLWGQRLLWHVWIANSATTIPWRKRRIIRTVWKQRNIASSAI